MRCAISFAAVLMAFALSGCGSSSTNVNAPDPRPIQWPTSIPWALRPGTWQEYRIYRGRGKFDRIRGWIDPDMSSLIAGEVNRNTNLTFMSQGGPSIARVYSPQGVTVKEVPAKLDGCLLERLDSSGRYIGEAGSYAGPDCTEPEPMVTLNPVAGETFRVTSIATRWDGVTFQHTVDYRTIGVGADFDGFKDCVLASTVESPGDLGRETVYCEAYDGEMAVQMYGLVEADGSVPALIYAKRVAMGVN